MRRLMHKDCLIRRRPSVISPGCGLRHKTEIGQTGLGCAHWGSDRTNQTEQTLITIRPTKQTLVNIGQTGQILSRPMA